MRILLYVIIIFTYCTNANSNTYQRVISTSPDITEIIYNLEADNNLVGVDTSSTYPSATAKLPKIGYKRAISVEGILSLNPDLLIINSETGNKSAINKLEKTNLKIVNLITSRSINDIKNNINKIAEILNKEDKAKELIKTIEKNSKILNQSLDNNKKPNVIFILQHSKIPLIAGKNTAADSIIHMAGAVNPIKYNGYKPLNPESLIKIKPDYILLTKQGLEASGGIEKFKELPSIKATGYSLDKNIIVMDSNKLLSFGPRTIEAALELYKKFSENND